MLQNPKTIIKILITDDDYFLNSLYQTKFTKKGFEVKVATNGKETLQLLQHFTPDVILLDLMMPQQDGFITLTQIREQEKFRHTPIIVASNLGQDEDINKALTLGADDYITKSDTAIDTIINKVIKIVERTRP